MSFVYITEQGAKIQKRGNVFQVGRNLELLMEIPAETNYSLIFLIKKLQHKRISSICAAAFLFCFILPRR